MDVFYRHDNVGVTLDTGATGNMVRLSTALGFHINKTSQSAHQADVSSPLNVIGETTATFSREDKTLHFEGLIVEHLDVDILAGTPFMESNDIAIRPARHQISLEDGTLVHYGSTTDTKGEHTIRRACILRAPPTPTTVWPGDYIEIQVPDDYILEDELFAIELRTDNPATQSKTWPPYSFL
jgi:hypothetical protein